PRGQAGHAGPHPARPDGHRCLPGRAGFLGGAVSEPTPAGPAGMPGAADPPVWATGLRPPAAVACVGAATMGAGIALAFALGGAWAAGVARRRSSRGAAWRRGEASAGLRARGGRVAAADREALLGRISGTTDLERADLGVDLVVEAIAEDAAVKRRLY